MHETMDTAERFYAQMATCTHLRSYALGKLQLPPSLPGLTPEAQAFLGTPEGRSVVGTWVRPFWETLTLLLTFRYAWLNEPGSVTPLQLERATAASLAALSPLVERLNVVATLERELVTA